MNIDQFKETLKENSPPSVNKVLEALWYDAKDDWDTAHKIVQDISSSDAAWVHAYLHRKEGDEGNAGYWYRRAGKDFCKLSLNNEWDNLTKYFLNK